MREKRVRRRFIIEKVIERKVKMWAGLGKIGWGGGMRGNIKGSEGALYTPLFDVLLIIAVRTKSLV